MKFEVLNLGDISIVSSNDTCKYSLLNTKENKEINQEELGDFLKTLSEDQLELLETYISVE